MCRRNRPTASRSFATAAASSPGGWTDCGIVGLPAGIPSRRYFSNIPRPIVRLATQSISRIGGGAFGNPSSG